MTILAGIGAIVFLALSLWAVAMALNPREWRLWWMSFLRRLDMQSTREQRRSQDRRFSIFAYMAFSLLLVAGCFCGFFAWSEWEAQRGPRSEAEQVRDKMAQDLQKMRQKKNFRKLE